MRELRLLGGAGVHHRHHLLHPVLAGDTHAGLHDREQAPEREEHAGLHPAGRGGGREDRRRPDPVEVPAPGDDRHLVLLLDGLFVPGLRDLQRLHSLQQVGKGRRVLDPILGDRHVRPPSGSRSGRSHPRASPRSTSSLPLSVRPGRDVGPRAGIGGEELERGRLRRRPCNARARPTSGPGQDWPRASTVVMVVLIGTRPPRRVAGERDERWTRRVALFLVGQEQSQMRSGIIAATRPASRVRTICRCKSYPRPARRYKDGLR